MPTFFAEKFIPIIRDREVAVAKTLVEVRFVSDKDTTPTENVSNINHPPHYNQGEIECIDAIKAMLSPEEFKGFLKGTVLKYLWRSPHKGRESEDLEKASWYHQRLLALILNSKDN